LQATVAAINIAGAVKGPNTALAGKGGEEPLRASQPWRLPADDRQGPIYSSNQLRLFEVVLNDAFRDLRAMNNPLASPECEDQTKRRLTAAIFRAAAAGESDFLWLKTKALQAMQ